RRFCVARRFIADDSTDTLFLLGHHVYRVWVTNIDLTPAGVWRFYDGRATIERRILELRSPCGKSRRNPSPPTRSTWKSSALRTTWLPHSSGITFRNLGRT